MLREIVDEGANPRRQVAALTYVDGVDRLGVSRIEGLQDRLQPSGLDVRPDVEQGQPRNADAGQRQLPRRLAVADLNVAGRRETHRFSALAERPILPQPREVEADEIVLGQIRESLLCAAVLQVARGG